jgi:hypothetical protein
VSSGVEAIQPPETPGRFAAPAEAERCLAALEVDRIVLRRGTCGSAASRVWLGAAMAGRTVTIWVDETSLHVLLDGARLKTLPSRLGVTELARLAAAIRPRTGDPSIG